MEARSKSNPISARRRRLTAVVVALSALVLALAAALPPHGPLDKADAVGYGICHQIPERSFFVAGRQLPLCARCTGTFLGALLGLAAFALVGRSRAGRLPPVAVLGTMVVFMALWALDGLNSYLTFFPGAPSLYEPQNWLRLTTGTLNGLAMITFVLPVLNSTVWREPAAQPVLRNLWEVLILIVVVAPLMYAVQAQIGFLLYPLAILSSLGVVVLLTLINAMLAAVVLGREGLAQNWRQAAVPLTAGAALAVAEITGLVLMRSYLTAKFGMPF